MRHAESPQVAADDTVQDEGYKGATNHWQLTTRHMGKFRIEELVIHGVKSSKELCHVGIGLDVFVDEYEEVRLPNYPRPLLVVTWTGIHTFPITIVDPAFKEDCVIYTFENNNLQWYRIDYKRGRIVAHQSHTDQYKDRPETTAIWRPIWKEK